mmetsp:Transcript_141867/g.257767  ORF Transcript_141867/g.257767 Transcript_141867/m.257767 type:complete len:239 (+) Transcript_141867:67-783(+)
MGCSPSSADHQGLTATPWTEEKSVEVQAAIDRVFETAGKSLMGLNFSFTIADPQLPECPIIGCSSGFTTLTGYDMDEIVGRNCRFLVDPVPPKHINHSIRRHCRDFCEAAAQSKGNAEQQELLAVQVNARKDGTLFTNLFFLRLVTLQGDNEEKTYIIGLQTEVPPDYEFPKREHLRQLRENLSRLEGIPVSPQSSRLDALTKLWPHLSEDIGAKNRKSLGAKAYIATAKALDALYDD